MQPTGFSQNVKEKLGYYVYLYLDPRDGSIFYVGKGTGDRAFAHLYDLSESAKVQRIAAIRAANLQPEIEILVHGLQDEETALRIEASIIDLIGIDKLTNQVCNFGLSSRRFSSLKPGTAFVYCQVNSASKAAATASSRASVTALDVPR